MVLLLSFSTCCLGQLKVDSPPVTKILIDSQTYVMASGKSSFRIITSNDTIARRFMGNMEDCMDRVSYIIKTDRNGKYWERSFYFKNSYWNIVALFIQNGYK